jgi:hypothetical protein
MTATSKLERAEPGQGQSPQRFRSLRSGAAPLLVRMLLGLGLIAPFLMIVVSTIAIGRAQDHNLISDTFSDLAAQGATSPGLMRAGMVTFGVLILGFAAGLGIAHPGYHRLMPVAVALFGASIACAGLFQDYGEARGAQRNSEGFAHNTSGVIAILSLLASMALAWAMGRASPALFRVRQVSSIGSILVLVASLVFNFGLTDIRGAAELVLYVAALTWIFSLARSTLTGLSSGEQGEPGTRLARFRSNRNLISQFGK